MPVIVEGVQPNGKALVETVPVYPLGQVEVQEVAAVEPMGEENVGEEHDVHAVCPV